MWRRKGDCQANMGTRECCGTLYHPNKMISGTSGIITLGYSIIIEPLYQSRALIGEGRGLNYQLSHLKPHATSTVAQYADVVRACRLPGHWKLEPL